MTITVPIRTTDSGIEPDLPEGTPYTNAVYDTEAGTLTVTVPPGTPVPGRLTRLGYSLLYTMEERVAIRQAAKVDPIVEDITDLLSMAEDVDLAHPATVQGVQYLEAQGILAEGRAAEILAGEPPALPNP